MKVHNDYLCFDSGNAIYASNGIVGITESLDVYEGYDGSIPDYHMSTQDKIELVTYMIGLWEEYAKKERNGV